MILSSLLATGGYIGLALWGTSFASLALFSVAISIGLGFADVIVDGFVVERSSPDTIGANQALCWRAKGWGILFASLFSGLLLQRAVFSSVLTTSPMTSWLLIHFPASFSTQMIGQINMLDIRYLLLFTGLWPVLTLILSMSLREPTSAPAANHPLSLPTILTALLAFTSTTVVILGLHAHQTASTLGVILIWSTWIAFYLRSLIRHNMATATLLFSALFLFLWRFTPSFGAPWSNYYLNTLHLSPEKLGLLGALSSVSWILGTWIYNRFLDNIPLKKLLFWTVLIGVVVSFTQLTLATPELGFALGRLPLIKYTAALLLYPIYFIVYPGHAWGELMTQPSILNLDAILSFLLEILFMISFLPLLKLAAKVTPSGVEATNFSILASVMNLGLAFGSISGGWIYTYVEGTYQIAQFTFTGLHLTIFIGAATSLICLPVLRKLKDV